MKSISFTVPGPPCGKGRPRFSLASGRTYTPKATQTAEGNVIDAWVRAGEKRIEGSVPLCLSLIVSVERPQSHFRANGELSALGLRTPHPLKAPDLDNVVKLVADALNGRAYDDDKQIVELYASRLWGEIAHVVVLIDPLEARQPVTLAHELYEVAA